MNENDKKKAFVRNILWLKEAYGNNFEFEILDENNKFTRKVDLWYMILGHIDSKLLEHVIFDYIKNSKWKPDSPAHILEHYKTMYLKLLPDASDEFEYAIELWRRDRYMSNTIKQLNEEGKTISAIAFKSIESQLHSGATTEDINKWAKRDYVKRYQIESETNTEKVITKQPNAFLIEDNKVLKLSLGE